VSNLNYLQKRETLEKRKIFVQVSLKQRKEKKLEKLKRKHQVLPPCKETCRHKCIEKIPEERRIEINTLFWKLGWTVRRTAICNLCEQVEVKRRRGKGQRKNKQCSYEYHLANETSINVKVCKQFFFTTLGSSKTNDRVVFDVLCKTVGQLSPPSNKWNNKKCVNVQLHDLVHILKASNQPFPTTAESMPPMYGTCLVM